MKAFVTALACAATLWAAPAKSLPSFKLKSMNGQTVASSSLLGKGPVIINFWATWCIPCMQEMTALKPIYEKYKAQGLQVVSISIDDAKTQSKVPAVVQSKGWPFLILMDPNKEAYDKCSISNAPEMLVVDKNGKIVDRHQGYAPGDEKKTEKLIRGLLGL
jgi:cytochrome c biogenesis protein CcmG, thiol:disulfide interchange protein DsbE